MRLRELFFPKDTDYFDLLRKLSETVLQGAMHLNEMCTKFERIEKLREEIKNCERTADINSGSIYKKLSGSFITPFDREDISKLTHSFDDIIDFIYAVANRIHLYKIKQPTPAVVEFSKLVLESANELDKLLATMARIDVDKIERSSTYISDLENKADTLLNESVANLFDEGDPIRIIKLKEIYEYLEVVTDKCKDVADVFREIGLKYS